MKLLIDAALGIAEIPVHISKQAYYIGVCHHFNSGLCRQGAACYYAHLCRTCGSADHGNSVCTFCGDSECTLTAKTVRYVLNGDPDIKCKWDLRRAIGNEAFVALSMSPNAKCGYAYFNSVEEARDAARRFNDSRGVQVAVAKTLPWW